MKKILNQTKFCNQTQFIQIDLEKKIWTKNYSLQKNVFGPTLACADDSHGRQDDDDDGPDDDEPHAGHVTPGIDFINTFFGICNKN